ncbi:phage tail protein [Pseudonocardia adelaidensis]|uniref:phage tail protein n=1 Tax=Pseudonocardia adelaidensis TaxID=648754 RepID=UPI0031E8FB62
MSVPQPVYVEEVAGGSCPIEGVGTAAAAFVGLAPTGPLNTPVLIQNWSQYVAQFGEFTEGYYLAHAVYGYLNNGGFMAYVVRVGGGGDSAADVRGSARKRGPPSPPPSRSLGSFRISALPRGTGELFAALQRGARGSSWWTRCSCSRATRSPPSAATGPNESTLRLLRCSSRSTCGCASDRGSMSGSVADPRSPRPLAEQLSAAYAENQFAQSFATGLDVVLGPLLTVLDCLDAYFTPVLAPEDFLDWLGHWIGSKGDGDTPLAIRREAIATPVTLHRRRGTAAGLAAAVRLVTG